MQAMRTCFWAGSVLLANRLSHFMLKVDLLIGISYEYHDQVWLTPHDVVNL